MKKCVYCKKLFKAVGRHYKWCKALEESQCAQMSAELNTAKATPNYQALYLDMVDQRDHTVKTVEEVTGKIHKLKLTNRALKEALCSFGVVIQRVMEIDL
jgi:hypothetical protein